MEANRDVVIVSAHHHMLRETTVGSGDWEGVIRKPDGTCQSRYHGFHKDAGAGVQGSSYLYFVGGEPKAMGFENYLAARPGSIDLWFGGHTHSNPDDVLNGRTHDHVIYAPTSAGLIAAVHTKIVPQPPSNRLDGRGWWGEGNSARLPAAPGKDIDETSVSREVS